MKSVQFLIASLLLPLMAQAETASQQGTSVNYVSPNGVNESCSILPAVPGGEYSEKDLKREIKNCSIDLYEGQTVALCPKTWSTSAAVMVYDIEDMKMTAEQYETQYCKGKSKPDEVSTLFKFKFTMNQSGTSGTFSQSPLMYYSFSRYFGTQVGTPVGVYREVDPQAVLDRVAKKGLAQAEGTMNKKAWGWIVAAIENPTTYKPTDDLFTADRTKMYGMAAKDVGERYGTEVNGARKGKGYDAQNQEFQETAAFRALRAEGDLPTAMARGLEQARQNSNLAKDLKDVSELQMAFWMRELTEISLLDYIMSQQDRVGNIDYEWKWYYVQDGKVESMDEDLELSRQKMDQIPVPAEIAAFNPVLVQRSHIGDNDAGGRVEYSNFAKRSKQLENLKHYSAKIYTRLINLNKDLSGKGEIYQYLVANFGLTDGEINQFVGNTQKATDIIKAQCLSGSLRFDLDSPKNYLIAGDKAVALDCENPVFE